ncbi:hypothetical protein [Maliponia aquimaris]|uniref:NADH dehydrogenase subunit E n=1 Tax=Maliponia aquimaris TaxID=1673631 RepID=A0A238K153_9RHOB|nr:hypothetical protein [Maliponia aquimaris]SMX36629.1 NADH dehydrogenase subunit E [Maliponia aquimaris]
MAQKTEMEDCGLMSWTMAAMAAFVAFVLLIVLGDWRVISAIFVSLVILAALGLAFSTIFCAKLPGPVLPGGLPASARPAAAAPVARPAPSSPVAAPLAATPKPDPAPEPQPVVAAEPVPEPAPEPAPESPAEDTAPAEAAPVRPRMLDAAPEDGGDDLKQIKGIGPKLEQLCKSLGIYRFDQIAAWTEAEIAWVDSNLEGFKGRVIRDAWVAQAKDLARDKAGGGTGS